MENPKWPAELARLNEIIAQAEAEGDEMTVRRSRRIIEVKPRTSDQVAETARS